MTKHRSKVMKMVYQLSWVASIQEDIERKHHQLAYYFSDHTKAIDFTGLACAWRYIQCIRVDPLTNTFCMRWHSPLAVKATKQIPIRNITIRWVVIIVWPILMQCIATHDTKLLACIWNASTMSRHLFGRQIGDKHDTVEWDWKRVPANTSLSCFVSVWECVFRSCLCFAITVTMHTATKSLDGFLFGKRVSFRWQSVNSFQHIRQFRWHVPLPAHIQMQSNSDQLWCEPTIHMVRCIRIGIFLFSILFLSQFIIIETNKNHLRISSCVSERYPLNIREKSM